MEGAPSRQNRCPGAKPDTPEDPERPSSVSRAQPLAGRLPKSPLEVAAAWALGPRGALKHSSSISPLPREDGVQSRF
ncbi:unnamed protein product [Rangifer tarandus platyrhynchus]|uniref:Uncharacterized protein n=1 Tax=Rangifer tarandus platyrhynchus TaxID=3082113 RepID=A0AC59ZMX2_RANTA